MIGKNVKKKKQTHKKTQNKIQMNNWRAGGKLYMFVTRKAVQKI